MERIDSEASDAHTRLVFKKLLPLLLVGCVDTMPQPDASCIDLEYETTLVELFDNEIVAKFDGSLPYGVDEYFTCPDSGALHVLSAARLSIDGKSFAIQRIDGTCRLAHIDRIQPTTGGCE
jgi:hypothetical protein